MRPEDLELPVALYLLTSAFEPLCSECEVFVRLLVQHQTEALALR